MTDTIDVQFFSGDLDPITLKVFDIESNWESGAMTFKPATLKILGDLFEWDEGDNDTTDRKIMNFIVDFGREAEVWVFHVRFSSDEDYHSFRKWRETAYFDQDPPTKPLMFKIGSSGDPFYERNNVSTLGKYYEGAILSAKFRREIPTQYWTGTIRFAIGRTLKAG